MLKSRLKLFSTGNFESSCMVTLWFKYSEIYIKNLYKNNVIYYYNIWLSWHTCDGTEPPFPCSTFSELLWPWTVVQTPFQGNNYWPLINFADTVFGGCFSRNWTASQTYRNVLCSQYFVSVPDRSLWKNYVKGRRNRHLVLWGSLFELVLQFWG